MKEPPPILFIYQFCKEFGWTINEVLEQPAVDLYQFQVIINEIHEYEEKEYKKIQSKTR